MSVKQDTILRCKYPYSGYRDISGGFTIGDNVKVLKVDRYQCLFVDKNNKLYCFVFKQKYVRWNTDLLWSYFETKLDKARRIIKNYESR